MSVVLALGAHFDDIEVGVAGILHSHIMAKDTVYMAIIDSKEHLTGDPKDRYNEQIRAVQMLGVDIKNIRTYNEVSMFKSIVEDLDSTYPDIIYCPFEKDTHQLHVYCSSIGLSVSRKPMRSIYYYHCGSSVCFVPSMFHIYNWDYKEAILNCFRSQVDIGSLSIGVIKARERYFGSIISKSEDIYAEGLIPVKVVK